MKSAERQLFMTEAKEVAKTGRGKRPSRSKKLVSGLNHLTVNEETKNASSVVSISGMMQKRPKTKVAPETAAKLPKISSIAPIGQIAADLPIKTL